jgi:hypothetical protein
MTRPGGQILVAVRAEEPGAVDRHHVGHNVPVADMGREGRVTDLALHCGVGAAGLGLGHVVVAVGAGVQRAVFHLLGHELVQGLAAVRPHFPEGFGDEELPAGHHRNQQQQQQDHRTPDMFRVLHWTHSLSAFPG